MSNFLKYAALAALLYSCTSVTRQAVSPAWATEPHRPHIHFTPRNAWMNDPNGMVYHNGTYHLFYQHNPDSTVWGPMHWGHATSTDLVHWQHQPIALYPDRLGTIFSGSAVIDESNTSGFGKNGKPPMVAIFTHHLASGEKEGRTDFQNQSLAYSLDEGRTWTKYSGNPVLKNPGIKDFRDPKVSWHEATQKWIMTLATLDRITFYSSPNLKDWTKESEFGKSVGAHGGVWECPDLFALDYNGQKVWVLLVSINPGGPNGGSATQYFTGNFDGKIFTPFQTDTRWIDYGPDNYAGVTWSGTTDRKIFMGWMSNWLYADAVPTQNWRSAMTVPRELSLAKVGDRYYLRSSPVKELSSLAKEPVVWKNIAAGKSLLTENTGPYKGAARMDFAFGELADFTLTLFNEKEEKVIVGFDKTSNTYFIDRTSSGQSAFKEGFAQRVTVPRLLTDSNSTLTLILDVASVEVFADNGLTNLTAIFFPTQPFTSMQLQWHGSKPIEQITYVPFQSMYTNTTELQHE